MYIDTIKTKRYTDYLTHAAQEYGDAQADAVFLKQRLGRASAWVGAQLLKWGQRLQAESTTTNAVTHFC